MKLFGFELRRTQPAPQYEVSGPWSDLGETTAESLAITKPINIHRSMLDTPHELRAGDYMHVKYTRDFSNGVRSVETPEFAIDRNMRVDSVTRFEVIDEFGVDVGIGFVLGQAK